MDEAELRRRTAEANRLLAEPLLREAFDAMTAAAIDRLMSCTGAEPADDRTRRALVDRLNVIRDVQAHLAMVIATGRQAAETPERWA